MFGIGSTLFSNFQSGFVSVTKHIKRFTRRSPASHIFILVVSIVAVSLTFNISYHPIHAAAPVKSAATGTALSKLSSSFIANAGQVDAAVRFQVKSQIGTLSFTPSGVTLDLAAAAQSPAPPSATPTTPAADMLAHLRPDQPGLPAPSASTSVAVQLGFIGENPNVLIDGADLLPGIANFFIGNDSTQWHTNVPTYAGVTYHELYPGIDLQYTGQTRLLKGTYTVAPNADPSLIRWRYSGADNLAIDAVTGDLHISAPDNIALTEQVPAAWQTRADGSQAPVTVRYALNADDSVQFVTGDYDHALPLVIDPGLIYSTYFGGTGGNQVDAIAIDNSGNVYMTGWVSGGFPTTAGALQLTYGGSIDTFIAKLNATGTALLYSTYLGGSNDDQATIEGITVDGSGNTYITGITQSTDFPVTAGAIQTVFGAGPSTPTDSFVTKLNATGSTLVYSTYLNSGGYAGGNGIVVDGSGDAYVTGYSYGSLQTTSGAFQPNPNATYGANAYVGKLNATGTALIYMTYLEGSGYDYGVGIKINASGNAYVAGYTDSADFPTTVGAYQPASGGATDAFVTEVNTTGTGLVFSTYVGGSVNDVGEGITRDSNGNIYITGYTQSTNYPTTANAYQTSYGGGDDSFVTELNSTGSSLIYSTYIGGSGLDTGTDVVVDNQGSIYATGYTSGNFPTTADAIQLVYGGGVYNAYLIRISTVAGNLVYSTYFGGNTYAMGYGLQTDGLGNVYIAGVDEDTIPITAGVYQPSRNSAQSGFVSAFAFPLLTPTPTSTPIPVPPATAAPLIDDPIEFDYTANQTTVIAAGNPGSDGGNNDDIALDVTLHNISSRPVTGLVLREQIQPALQIVGITSTAGTPTTNCDQITVVIGTLLPGQTALLTVQTQVSNTAALAPNASNLQPVMYTYADTNDAFSRSRHFVAPVLSLVNVGSASWDDQHYRTKVQIVRVLRPSALPSTGEHPAESTPSLLPEMFAFAVSSFGLLGFILLFVTRSLRVRSR